MAKSFLRTAHGKGAASALVRVEVPPVDELARGVLAASAPAGHAAPAASASVASRRPRGGRRQTTFTEGDERARAAQRRAVEVQRAKRTRLRALESLGLPEAVCGDLPDDLVPFLDAGDEFARAEIARLASSVGGGVVTPNVASIVQSAALQLAGSRMLFAKGKVNDGSRLADASRQNLLAAHELCAREAKARPEPEPWWEEARREIAGELPAGDADADATGGQP